MQNTILAQIPKNNKGNKVKLSTEVGLKNWFCSVQIATGRHKLPRQNVAAQSINTSAATGSLIVLASSCLVDIYKWWKFSQLWSAWNRKHQISSHEKTKKGMRNFVYLNTGLCSTAFTFSTFGIKGYAATEMHFINVILMNNSIAEAS